MGTWLPLTNQPSFYAGTMLLLTDGTVMCTDRGSPRWFQLTPDSKGDYAGGTWSQLADGPTAPEDFASAVLESGGVFVAGGEYQDGMEWDLLAAQVYNPVSNVWSVASVPAAWPNLADWTNLGDAPSCVLPDGRILVGYINKNYTAIYDPDNNTWARAADKNNPSSSEETWTLLPDGTVLSVDCDRAPGVQRSAQKYLIATDQWISVGQTPSDLVETASLEIGPAILLPDGRVFCIGATGHTAFYHMPPIANQPGSWSAGQDFPAQPNYQIIGAKDAPACLLPNGKVLCVAGPVDGVKDHYLAPMFFFEFDPLAGNTGSFALIPGPLTNPQDVPPFAARFLVLPTGQVLFANGTQSMSIYDPGGAPAPAWLPSVIEIQDGNGTSVKDLVVNTWFTLSGRQLNGLSQANSYGDDAQMATNYPLVRIRNNTTNDLTYCGTQNHSSMGVATGNTVQTTQFLIPSGIAVGESTLQVVANGIASAPFAVTIWPWAG